LRLRESNYPRKAAWHQRLLKNPWLPLGRTLLRSNRSGPHELCGSGGPENSRSCTRKEVLATSTLRLLAAEMGGIDDHGSGFFSVVLPEWNPRDDSAFPPV